MIPFPGSSSRLLFLLALALSCVSLRADAAALMGFVASGENPRAIAVNTATNKIYVVNTDSNDVTVIDGLTNATSTVPSGLHPVQVAVNPVTNKIYVTNTGSYDVTVIDGATNSTSTVVTGPGAGVVAVDPVTNKIYVTAGSNGVTVIDGATNAISTVMVSPIPFGVAVNAVTNKTYVVSWHSNMVSVIDGATNTSSAVAMEQATHPNSAVVVNQVTNKIYVSTINSISIIDGLANSVRTLASGQGTGSLAINQVTNKIYVNPSYTSAVDVIDGETNVLGTVVTRSGPNGAEPGAMVVNATANRIYVSNAASDSIVIIDGTNNTAGILAIGAGPGPLAVNPVTNRLYVVNHHSNSVAVIDGEADEGPITATAIEFYHAALDHYFITADRNEVAAIDNGTGAGAGWARTGNSFNSGGGTPVCRFYGSANFPGPNSHFYTADKAECDSLKRLAAVSNGGPRWNFEGFDFLSTVPVFRTCPAGMVPVYRAYNNGFANGRDSNHRITTNQAAIQEVVNRSWINEGVVMCAPA